MSALVRVWKANFLKVELVLGLIAGAAFVFWAERLGGMAQLDPLLKDNRAPVYGALASIFGALLGFVITAVSILLGFASSDKLTVVRNSPHYHSLWDVFTISTKVLGLATIAAFIGLLLDREHQPCHPAFYATTFAAILTLLCLARCLWVLEQVIKLLTAPPKAPTNTPT